MTVVVRSANRADVSKAFARRLRRLYHARPAQPEEIGVHRLVTRLPEPDGRRITTWALVGTDSWDDGVVQSYILTPYTLAKNHVTGRESDDVTGVLSGRVAL